jgi:hypothetical protein
MDQTRVALPGDSDWKILEHTLTAWVAPYTPEKIYEIPNLLQYF